MRGCKICLRLSHSTVVFFCRPIEVSSSLQLICQADYVADLTGSFLPSAEAKHINKLRRYCRALKRPAMTGSSKHHSFTKLFNWGTLQFISGAVNDYLN